MKDGKCTNNYPFAFSEETTRNDNGYPHYRRRMGSEYTIKCGMREIRIDNRWIVPHNPWLTTKYNAHINTEICSSVAAVKYLYKYVYKGHDRTNMTIVAQNQESQDQPNDIDEIKEFVDSRYVSACESLWRIFKFPLHNHSPTVVRLSVHLEGQHSVTFPASADLARVIAKARDSHLLAWFKLNQNDPTARVFTYPEIPQHYTWDRKGRYWKKRAESRKSTIITRMYFVNPRERERYCLRLLLLHVKGATCFQDIRTVEGMDAPCNTYSEAALARHLLEDDTEWRDCLEEAALSAFPNMLRLLFVTILQFCNPSEPRQLWDNFGGALSEDYLYHIQREFQDEYRYSPEEVLAISKRCALYDIDRILQEVDSSLNAFFNLPRDIELPQAIKARFFHGEIPDQDNLDRFQMEAERNINLLNADQQTAFTNIINAIQGETQQKLFFIDGPGGTGKSFLYNTLITYIRGELRKPLIVVASSGIAALILHGGRTAHSTFNIPVPITNESVCNIGLRQEIAKRIQGAAAIFWDEAPMQHRYTFEAVDRSFRDIMGQPDVPFGGKVFVFGGDFRQILPIVVRGSRSHIENACLKHSKRIWHAVETLKLKQNMRVRQDPQNQPFVDFLLRIGEGREPTLTMNQHNDYVRIPDAYIFHPTNPSETNTPAKQLIKEIYHDLRATQLQPNFLIERAILTTLNEDVNKLNDIATDMLPGDPARTYLGLDTIVEGNADALSKYPLEFVNSIDPPNLPPFKLKLKVGQPVILIRNLNTKEGLCNGTRFIIRELGVRSIKVEALVGQFRGHNIALPRIPITTTDGDSSPVLFRRLQFPIKPAFAMTINKAQGQTLDTVGLYLPQPVFSHGQLYVALSRCTKPNNLKVLIENGTINGYPGVYTRNIVYQNVLK
jgi:hypothetical protein